MEALAFFLVAATTERGVKETSPVIWGGGEGSPRSGGGGETWGSPGVGMGLWEGGDMG